MSVCSAALGLALPGSQADTRPCTPASPAHQHTTQKLSHHNQTLMMILVYQSSRVLRLPMSLPARSRCCRWGSSSSPPSSSLDSTLTSSLQNDQDGRSRQPPPQPR